MIAARAVTIARWMTLVFAALYVLAGVWLAFGIPGYAIAGPALTDGISNPLYKQVAVGGSWLASYMRSSVVLDRAAAGAGVSGRRAGRCSAGAAWPASSPAPDGGRTIVSAGFALFPFLLPSSLDPHSSLTVWDASSSRSTLG